MAHSNFIMGNAHIINMHRGDSFRASIFINKGSSINPIRYYVDGTDLLFLGIMEPNQCFEKAIIKKVYDAHSDTDFAGDIIFSLDPVDTEYLNPGLYYYQAKLLQHDTHGKEYVTTVIDKTPFYIIN